MLADLDRSIATFLGRLLPPGTTVGFDPPAAIPPAAMPPGMPAAMPPAIRPGEAPFLDAFLYDVREAQPPVSDGALTRDEAGYATGWQPPVRRYRACYLLTAWTGTGSIATNEHELLGSVLAGCAAVRAIPQPCLYGVLAEAGEPVLLTCAAPDRAGDAAWLWPRLGICARTALDLTVVAPVVPPLATNLSPGVRSVEYGVRRNHGRGHPATAPTRPPRPDQHITEA
ncbi:MAG TPA: Pvc16 family protein [Streptosporangiaceae bacterium]